MAEFIVAGLAVASTPPALFAFERLNDALSGKNWEEKQEQKPEVGEAEDILVLPNLLKPKTAVKGNAGKKEDQKPFLSEAKDVLPNLLKPTNVAKGNAGEKEDPKRQLGKIRVVTPTPCPPNTPTNVLKGHASNKVSLVSEPPSPQNSSRSTTTAETEPESLFSIDGIVEQDAANPYLLNFPSGYPMEQDTRSIIEQDTTNPYLLKFPSSHHMERRTSK